LLILLEGADCVGKSQLARRLRHALGHGRYLTSEAAVSVIHRGPPTAHPLIEYVKPLLNYRPDGQRHLVCDRWHVGESVYPTVVGRPTQQDAAVHAYIELFLLTRGALLVHVRRTSEYLIKCGIHRNDSAEELERVRETTDAFERVVGNSLLPTVSLDVDEPTEDDVAFIIDQAATAAYRASQHRFTTYVGAIEPTLLMFGDRRGVNGDPRDYGRWPAFTPFADTCGHYLMSVLTRQPLRVPVHGTLLSTVAFANANDVDNPQHIWEDAGRPRVVALGTEARKTLRRKDVPISHYAPHPQYWRRFRHHEPDVYLRRLLNHVEVAEVTGG
jgi:hypothetical protein